MNRERLELIDPTTHGCSSGDLGSEVFLTCPRSTPVAKEVHRWPRLGGLGHGGALLPRPGVSATPGPAAQGWAVPSFMSGIGGLAGSWWSFVNSIGLGCGRSSRQPGSPGPGQQWESVMLTWLTGTQQEPEGPRTASRAEDSWRASRGVVGRGLLGRQSAAGWAGAVWGAGSLGAGVVRREPPCSAPQ